MLPSALMVIKRCAVVSGDNVTSLQSASILTVNQIPTSRGTYSGASVRKLISHMFLFVYLGILASVCHITYDYAEPPPFAIVDHIVKQPPFSVQQFCCRHGGELVTLLSGCLRIKSSDIDSIAPAVPICSSIGQDTTLSGAVAHQIAAIFLSLKIIAIFAPITLRGMASMIHRRTSLPAIDLCFRVPLLINGAAP